MRLALSFLLLAGLALGAAPDPATVAVVYNRAVPESARLAETYREARKIPRENLIGLDLPAGDQISRPDYDAKLRDPLRAAFDRNGWWRRGKTAEGFTVPGYNRIRFLAVMRGIPLRIPNTQNPPPGNDTAKPFAGHNEAAVDSELAVFGIDGPPLDGAMPNAFFNSAKPLSETRFPFLLAVSRIDAADWDTCERMIRDAIETEKSGLWGRAYIDIANKTPEGDQWLEAVVKANLAAGIPTVVDRFNDTLPTNYPMTEASLYYGWYEWNVNGPFLNPRFRFRPGAVAMHLHSFSAEQIRNPNANWSAALLARGAAATVGNVYEPYLGLTHHFDVLQQRLLDGFTFAEAALASVQAVSWQAVAFGDPLYRPFARFDGSGDVKSGDRDFIALRLAAMQWGKTPPVLLTQLEKAAERTGSGTLAEAVGLRLREQNLNAEAARWFETAKNGYVATEDKLRQDFNLIAIDRATGRKDAAARGLRDAKLRYGPIPEADGLTGWLNLVDPPPPPPPADATKKPGKS